VINRERKVLERLLNLVLRGTTLVSKFALLFVLAKFLEPLEVGLYGLFSATIFYCLMALGFDFYTYSTRELIVTDRKKWAGMLRDQGIFYTITYTILIPVSFLIFWFGFLPWELVFWFFPLLALEHVAQELNRLLVAISEPLWASVILFIRQGCWAIMTAGILWIFPEQRHLTFVLAAWTLGVSSACILGFIRLRNLDSSSLKLPVDWKWIKKGIKVASPFLLATLSLRALYTSDRYWVEAISGLEVLAAYVFFAGIANAIMSFLDAAVFSFTYPELIAAVGRKDTKGFKTQLRRMGIQTTLFTLTLSASAIILTEPIIHYIKRDVYSKHLPLLYWTILATAISSISMIPHYGLYALRQDTSIIVSHIFSLPIFFIGTVILLKFNDATSIPMSLTFTFLFLLIFKYLMLKRNNTFAA
jgi:O-antigen/teichoic acid export membrane protein